MANTLITQLNNPVVMQQLNKRLAAIVSLLLIVACAYMLVEITWMFFSDNDDAMLPVQQQKRPLLSREKQQDNFNQLTSSNLFGISEKAAVQQQTKAPETKLNLTLKGVLAATPMDRASAIIAQGKAGKEDIYSVGDKLSGGVEIREIHPEYVVLDRSGILETLKLQKISGIDKANGGANSRSTRNRSSSWRAGGSSSPAAALKQIRNDIIKNPTSFGEYALPVVVKENGKQIGYRLQPQKKGQLLSELGVQSSDVITQINGVKLNEPKNGINALRALSTAKNLNLVVKRNGTEVPLNISLP